MNKKGDWVDIYKGDWVDIYEDPLTEKQWEGRAKILQIAALASDGLALAEVQFERDDPNSKHIRLVKVQ